MFTCVNSALQQAGVSTPSFNFIGGLGGDDITPEDIRSIFASLEAVYEDGADLDAISFLGISHNEGSN